MAAPSSPDAFQTPPPPLVFFYYCFFMALTQHLPAKTMLITIAWYFAPMLIVRDVSYYEINAKYHLR